MGSANTNSLQLFGPSIQPRHCLISLVEGVCTVTPLHADALTFVNGHHIGQPTILHVSTLCYRWNAGKLLVQTVKNDKLFQRVEYSMSITGYRMKTEWTLNIMEIEKAFAYSI